MPELSVEGDRLKAIIFDLDGTLYHQDALRRVMLLRLLSAHLSRPRLGLRTLRVLSAYRRAQDLLRASGCASPASVDLAAAQIQLACERSGEEVDFVAQCVARWMEQEPLALLARHIRPGLLEFLRACKARGLRLGVLSDYPADDKLRALGLVGLFDVVLAAQSPEIGFFKPHPHGLLLVIDRLGLSPSDCLYVGDRADVDASAAAAASMACCIISRQIVTRGPRSWMQVNDFLELHARLWDATTFQHSINRATNGSVPH